MIFFKYYNFGYFTMSLNELKEGMEKVIAPTDSRYRGDVKQLELGDLGMVICGLFIV